MIMWILWVVLVNLCAAQNSAFTQSNAGSSSLPVDGFAPGAGSQFNQFPLSGFSASLSAGGSQFNQLPSASSVGASASSSAGATAGSLAGSSASSSAGSSASSSAGSFASSSAGASAGTFAQVATPQSYPACLASNPTDAVTSSSPFAYSLLEASFTNPFLKTFYNTTYDPNAIYNAAYEQVKESLPKSKSQILAGSLSLLFKAALPYISPLLNAVSITNAFNEILSEEGIVIAYDKEDYIEPYLSSISRAISDSDGSAGAQARALVTGLLNYSDYVNILTYSKFHEFINILAGEYYLAISSTCKPSSFELIPKLLST